MISSLKLSTYDSFESIEILKNLPDVNKLYFPNQPSTYNFNPDDFEFVDRIFGHQQSVVECYTHTPTQIELAIKFVRIPHDQQHSKDLTSIKRLQIEIEAHKKVSNSSTIVGFYGFCVLADHILICMELMDMSLRDFYLCMHKEGNMVSEDTLYVIISSVLNALMDCKKMNVMHRDIKPLNILLNSNGEIKLCDFGLARILDESKASTFVGTFAYWPPERFSAEVLRYDFRAEIWSLGITMLEVICGKLPYPIERADFFIFQNAIKTHKFDLDALLTNYSDDLKAFIDYCLKPVLERPSLDSEVFSEKYTRIISSEEYIKTVTFFRNSRKRISAMFHQPVNVKSNEGQMNKNADLSIPLQCDRLLLSIRIALENFSDFRELLKDKDKFDYYAEKSHEFYTEKLHDNIQVYPHFSKPKGLAIIINEIDWAPNPKKRRDGPEKDAKKLEILFRELGYEIYQEKTLEHLTKKEMLDHLEAFATDVRHKDGSSCIVVIMAHINEDVVYDIQSTRILINHEIKPLFNGENAKDLVGKPKLFIYQSCRRENYDYGVDFDDHAEIQKLKNSLASKQKIDGACLGKLKDPDSSPNDPSPDSPRRIPIYSDFFVLYATVSFRSSESGSKFISAICDTFYKFAHLYDLENMARNIKMSVADCKFHLENEQTKRTEVYQQPQLGPANSKEFYMFPGVYIN